MYQVYIKKETGYIQKELIGEYRDFNKACEKFETEVAKNNGLKYVMEETTGAVDGLGELIARVVKEN